MPQPRRYENRAARQKAYRDRKRHAADGSVTPTRVHELPGFVYLAKRGRQFKIGATTGPPSERVEDGAYRKGNGDKLVSFVSSETPFELEKELHEKFAEHHIKGEWFDAVPEIRAAFP